MNFKSESPENSRKGWLFIALGIALGIAALISILRAMKMAG